MAARKGTITIQSGVDVWPHELRCAQSLAAAGNDVEFLRKTSGKGVKSPDLLMGGLAWELKSPECKDAKALQRILR